MKSLIGRLTLRARLTLIYGGLFMIAGVMLLGVTYALFNQRLDNRVVVKGTYLQRPQSPGTTPQPGAVPTSPNLWVLNPSGDVLTGPDAERVMEQQQAQVRDAARKTLLVQGSIALVLVGALAAGSGWIVAGRVLAPLHRVTDTARRIAAAPAAGRGLHERIALSGPDDDVKDLADAFDTMVERLDHSFDGQRRFVANASHELRTPLTLSRALVEVAMHRKTASADVKQLGENLLAINARHEQLINGLLALADSDKVLTAVYPVNLSDVTAHVVAQLAAEAAQARIDVHAYAMDAPTTGDALLLERLVHNLVENGIRHNTQGDGWVSVASRSVGDRVEVEVENTGPDVPPYEVEGLFKPFRRLGDDRLVAPKGAGLGLSIVRSVAEAHDGTVRAAPRDGGGLTVVVSLPVDPG
ncbi:signal transduction histidine kinase [Kribbella sp. VKM Ac-2527]|uniref:histidine kinase n=1 Tax=Kribbella caucasensis TaxID=2512215 RepID=A0A4V3C8V9_9ACTN|nr:HAMP domain-containing sensor histidine kinase [Kribbella sp. VKM Ac-2527]TDO43088.1 signal transduction histidine kinase [Kribbella sp. VKM Ac-2527]